MDINEVYRELDGLFKDGRLDEVEDFLKQKLALADNEGDVGARLGILNELIGFYREMTRKTEVEEAAKQIMEALELSGLSGTIEAGTSLMNIANAYRFLGDYDKAIETYKKVEDIYTGHLDKDDFRWPSLYNNTSLVYSAIQDYDRAINYLNKALELALSHEDADIEIAVTYTNIGQAYMSAGDYEAAEASLVEAEKIFAAGGKTDYHYSGCANAYGALYTLKGDYERAVRYYEEALLNIYDTVGITDNYKAVHANLMVAYDKAGIPTYNDMLSLCEGFYKAYGEKLISDEFADYADKIAVGLCGEGSECLGFDDDISLDHDCGPGFAMYVNDEVYAAIGDKLQECYDRLPRVFAGYIRKNMHYAGGRVGVCRINDFYNRVLGGAHIPENEKDWLDIPEYALATAVSGKVFADPEGEFSRIRAYLKGYYPDRVWYERLSRELLGMAQTGQYNYGRMMTRKEYVTVDVILGQYMQHLMNVVFLLNRTYAPYYKWTHKAMKKLERLPELAYVLEAIADMPSQREAWEDKTYTGLVNEDDMVAMTIEIIARMIVDELHSMGLSKVQDTYLEAQAMEVAKHMSEINQNNENTDKNRELTRDEKIALIIELEWNQFDLVKNEGGRASCQDDWNTFSLMRKSQYMTWTDDMLSEFIYHFNTCISSGRNIITEKYGRMMESTCPERYNQIKDSFPVISDERKRIQETIIAIQVEWMEEFAAKYPKMAANARSIHTSEDTPYNTSYETYLRGELGTYSPELLDLYGHFIAKLAKEGKNLAYETMNNTAVLYGYDSVEKAEEAL